MAHICPSTQFSSIYFDAFLHALASFVHPVYFTVQAHTHISDPLQEILTTSISYIHHAKCCDMFSLTSHNKAPLIFSYILETNTHTFHTKL